MGAWRPTQDILRFDADFYGMLAKTGVSGNLPVEILERMPAWALYFETRELVVEGRHYDGFSPAWTRATTGEQLILRLHFVALENMAILAVFVAAGRLERGKRPLPEPTSSSAMPCAA